MRASRFDFVWRKSSLTGTLMRVGPPWHHAGRASRESRSIFAGQKTKIEFDEDPWGVGTPLDGNWVLLSTDHR
jgi:hypothetical protein